jgi:hypothetical protein
MFQESDSGAPASPNSADATADYEELRHLLYGSLRAINSTIHFLHKRGYAEPNDWCEPIPTGRQNEWMVILTKRVLTE